MAENPKIQRTQVLVLITVIVGTFLGRLDQTIVTLALPHIMEDFSITVTAAGWIATAYILANAIFVPIWGKLGDTVGRKKVYILGFIIFIAGSILSALSWNLSSLIVFRVIQAVASSADYPTAMAILATTFPEGRQRTQALGLWSASFAAAAVFGPLIGGPLIDNFTWRSIFWLNLPVGIVGLTMAWVFIKESVSRQKTVFFDWWGAITLGAALSALVLVLDKGLDWGWTSVSSIICYVLVAIFAVIFYKLEKRSRDPIVDFKFFKDSVFVTTLLNSFVIFMGMMGGMFLIPIFASTFLGMDATQTGLLFMPMAAMMLLAAPLGGSFAGRVQPRFIIAASTAIAAVGLYLLSFIDPKSGPIDIIIPLVVMAFGMGFGMPQRTSLIAASAPPEEVGAASSILALARNVAGAFGVALFGTILDNSTESHALSLAKYSVLHSVNPMVVKEFIALVELKAQALAYSTVFQVAAFVILLGAFLALMIKVKWKKGSGGEMVMVD